MECEMEQKKSSCFRKSTDSLQKPSAASKKDMLWENNPVTPSKKAAPCVAMEFPEVVIDASFAGDSSYNNLDPHSSEEELETINSNSKEYLRDPCPEKRKWSFVNGMCYGESNESSDEDTAEGITAPVEFRASPPANAHKPHSDLGFAPRRRSPPAKVIHLSPHVNSQMHLANPKPFEICTTSLFPPKRHRSKAIQRPFLDLEKMQLKSRSVQTWRTGGELSLFCGS